MWDVETKFYDRRLAVRQDANQICSFSQRRPKQNGITASAPYQTITVPICRMGIMSPQEIWLLIPWLNQRDDAQIVSSPLPLPLVTNKSS